MTRSALIIAPARIPAAAETTTCADMSDTFPATHTPGTAVAPVGSAATALPTTWPRISCSVASSPNEARTSCARGEPGGDDDDRPLDDLAGDESDPGEPVAAHLQPRDLAVHHADPEGGQLLGLVRRELRPGVPEERDVVAELPEQQRLVHGVRPGREDADRLVADLPPVAVGQCRTSRPTARRPRQVGQLVDEAGGDEQAARADLVSVVERHAEGAVVLAPGGRDDPGHHLSPVAGQLRPADGQRVTGRCALPAEVVVHAVGRGVARLARVDDEDRPARARQGHRPAQPGGAPADDHDVVLLVSGSHAATVSRHGRFDNYGCWYGKDFRSAAGGRRPRRGGSAPQALRTERNLTLGAVSRTTGVSVSTLSRLESGGRKPTLELLLPLARAYQVALDDLVEAAPPADPRIHPRPFDRNGMTMVPLTRQEGGLQSYKLVFPAQWPAVRPSRRRTTATWLYVLSGRLRLQLNGLRALIRRGGRVRHPRAHAFTNPFPEPAEVLVLFGPQGERMHVRARPRGRTSTTG